MSRDQEATGLSSWARTWVREALGSPTPVQEQAWPVLSAGKDAVLVAPTGSGKTLAAFLSAIDRLVGTPMEQRGRVLYVSPLKALAFDIERNLRSPLIGLQQVAARDDTQPPPTPVRVGVRTGDTTQRERTQQAKNPPDVWITTPESLYLLLTSQARSALLDVDTVIIDEVHAMLGTKRGAHLAVSLERLEALANRRIQRIALSATVQPVSEVARYVRASDPTSVAIIAPSIDKHITVEVESTVADFDRIGEPLTDDTGAELVSGSAAGDPERDSIWPSVAARVVDIIAEHRSSIVFVNSRRLAERITSRLNDIAEERGLTVPFARAHHGSVAKDVRRAIEEDLKQGRLTAVVATSSMELGIDMGDVDVVVQIQSPTSVASGLQRVGRAGHGVGQISTGHVIATHAHDLLIAHTIGEEMIARHIEDVHVPSLPLDVLAQQIVAMCAMDECSRADLLAIVRRAASYSQLSDALFDSVLAMLSGSYPSDRFAQLRPRLVWDRTSDRITARPGAQRLAVTNAGTIPDRGLFGVHVATEGMPRVGELDEEMVYETRTGEVITLGASSWRVEEITHDRVLVSPAPGASGRMPFWHGDALGRPAQLAAAIGRTVREGSRSLPALNRYLDAQRAATVVLPDESRLVVEAFRDEIGDWRVVVHSPYGARVHAPWALAVRSILAEQLRIEPQVMYADDGIVLRLPDFEVTDPADGQSAADQLTGAVIDALSIDPEDIEYLVHREVTGSALFAARFRECAARSLLLPRHRPDRRSPLWQQRRRAQHLLEVAADFPDFPIVLETMRECVQDAYDLPALTALLRDIRSRDVDLHVAITARPSPFARSLLFGYVATYMYEGDAPLAERRAQALSIDMELLADLLGTSELRTLLDAEAMAEVEADLAHRSERTRARDVEDAADLLRILGPLDGDAAAACGIQETWLAQLVSTRRAITVHIAGRACIAAIEDAGRLRDALGTVLPPGIPDAHLGTSPDPLGDLVSRYARTHGPFTATELVHAFALPIAVVNSMLHSQVASGALLRGEFRPGGSGEEFCDRDVLRRIRRSSVAHLREEIEPVELTDFAQFVLQASGVQPAGNTASAARVVDGDDVAAALDRLSAFPLPASTVLGIVHARIPGVQARHLDALLAARTFTWWSLGPLGSRDMTIAWAPAAIAADVRAMLRDGQPRPWANLEPTEQAVVEVLRAGGAFDVDSVHASVIRTGTVMSWESVEATLWDLAAYGWVTCDSWSALQARVIGRQGPRVNTRMSTRGRSRSPRRTRMVVRSGGPRWSMAPGLESTTGLTPPDGLAPASNPEEAAVEYAGIVLERWTIASRLTVSQEQPTGGFAGQYRVLSALAEAGSCQRVYAVDGAGGAQFAVHGAVDSLRESAARTHREDYVVSALDPASPFGTLLPWPPAPEHAGTNPRLARRTGAVVALRGANLRAYVEASGGSIYTWGIESDDDATALLRDLAHHRQHLTTRSRALLTTIDGTSLLTAAKPPDGQSRVWTTLVSIAGFTPTPRGWRWPSSA